jgi:tRNA G37 N-methylase Trm5
MFDVTKSMFASGNGTERMRVARFPAAGETIVDLYAGIGYFTLPYLIHARAAKVHPSPPPPFRPLLLSFRPTCCSL